MEEAARLDRGRRTGPIPCTPRPAQEAIVVELRRTLPLPLDDLVAVTRELIHPDASRSCPPRLGPF